MSDKLKNTSKIGKVTNILLNILIAIFVIILFFSIYMGFQIKVLGNDYGNFFGYSFFETQTGSMKDEINPGDWIVVKLTDDVKVGDVVTYKQDESFITHRIIEMYKGTYVTKGDANQGKDQPIDESQVIGKVIKVLPGFGFVKKTIFNKEVIFALIVIIFVVNLLFKKDSETTKFEKVVKNAIRSLVNNEEEMNDKPIETKQEVIETEIIEEQTNEKTEEIVSVIEIEEKTLVEDVEKEKTIEDEEPIITIGMDDETEKKEKIEETEEDLSKTQTFRFITIGEDEKKTKKQPLETVEQKNELDDKEENVVKVAEIKIPEIEEKTEEELSKTTVLKYIQVDASDIKDTKSEIRTVKSEVKKAEKKAKEAKKKGTTLLELDVAPKKKNIGDNNYDIKRAKQIVEENITRLRDVTEATKAKNLVDKIEQIKITEITEILNVLTLRELEYVKKSTIKNEFIKAYIKANYTSVLTTKTLKNVKDSIEELVKRLEKKYTDKIKQLNIVKVYEKHIITILNMEQLYEKNEHNKDIYVTLLEKNYKWDEQFIEFVTTSTLNIQNKTRELISENQQKLNSKSFRINEVELSSKKNTKYVELDHSIEFSKSYSDYIVDKTYNEGIVAEEKLAVMLSLLSVSLTENLLQSTNQQYLFRLPTSLYKKEKKIEGLLKLVDNEYSKNHTQILVDIDTMIESEELILSLIKKGYNFVVELGDDISKIEKVKNELELIKYCIIDKKQTDIKNMMKALPNEITEKTIKEDIAKLNEIRGEN